MATITVKSQQELTRVLANATTDIAVEMGPDAQGRVQDYYILAPTTVILKVTKGAKLTAHVPDLTVDVNGGIFDGNDKPHHVFINSGSASSGRGSRVTALGGTFRERGGATDAETSAHIDNDAQAHISSGVVNVHGKAWVAADGNAEVYAFDDAEVYAFGRAKVRADDNVTLRAHGHSEGHLHGKATGYGSGPVVLTMVSPASTAQVGSSAKLRVGEGVPHTQFNTSADVEPEFISAEEASLPDTLNRIRGRGKTAFHRNAPAAPIMDEEVAKFLEGREPGDPLNLAVMKAYEEGYRSQADAAAASVVKELPVTPPAVAVPEDGIGFDGNCDGCGDPFVKEGRDTHHIFPTGEINHDADASHRAYAVEDNPLAPSEKVLQLDENTLVKLKYRKADGKPDLVQQFDWARKRWGRTMTCEVGPGREVVDSLRALPRDDRAVTKAVAARFGTATGKCLMCHKPLVDSTSVTRGYGPDCASKLR